MSLEDSSSRGAFGEILIEPPAPSTFRGTSRTSVPTSMASRDSLVLAGSDLLTPLPNAANADGGPSVSFGVGSNGAPIRPPRSPGLDLQLPKVTSPSPLTSPRDSRLGLRPPSGFPFGVTPSGTISNRTSQNVAPAPTSNTSNRGMSILNEDPRARSAQSHLSTMSEMSTSSNRSDNSAMGYILDHPQIITPVNKEGARVEVLTRGQAGLVKIGGIGSTSPGSPGSFGVSPPNSANTITKGVTENPFSDEASVEGNNRFSVGGINPTPSTSPYPTHQRTESDSTVTTDQQPNSSRWTASSMDSDSRLSHAPSITLDRNPSPIDNDLFDLPQSARSSTATYDTGNRSRPLTGESQWTTGPRDSINSDPTDKVTRSREGAESRESFQSDSPSMLDGIPFMGPATTELQVNTSAAKSGQLFPMPPPRSPSFIGPPSPGFFGDQRDSLSSFDDSVVAQAGTATTTTAQLSSLLQEATGQSTSLPPPVPPFAAQASAPPSLPTTPQRVQSQTISIRSGFGSGLTSIPFQLDGGLRDSMFDPGRDSMQSTASRDNTNNYRESYDSTGMLSGVSEQTEPGSDRNSFQSELDEDDVVIVSGVTKLSRSDSRKRVLSSATAVPTSSSREAVKEEEDPFADGNGADARASMDSMALSQALSQSLDNQF